MGPHDLQMYMGRLQTESQPHAGNNADAKGRMHATNTNPYSLTVLAVVRLRTSYSKFALTQRYGVAKVASKWHQSCPATHISLSKDRRKYYPSSALCQHRDLVQASKEMSSATHEQMGRPVFNSATRVQMPWIRHVWSNDLAIPRDVQCCAPVLSLCTCRDCPRTMSSNTLRPKAMLNNSRDII